MKNDPFFEENANVLKTENSDNHGSLSIASTSTGIGSASTIELSDNEAFRKEHHYDDMPDSQSRNENSDSPRSPKDVNSSEPCANKPEFEKSTLRPGECVMRTLFQDFTQQAARKMEEVMAEPMEKPLSKILQRGEDAQFDQLIVAFGTVAEHCLPSLLKILFAWYERQLSPLEPDVNVVEMKKSEQKGKSVENTDSKDMEALQERRDLAIEFMFCLVLIEVLHQLPFHPGHEDLINYIENVSFKHFKYREGVQTGPNASNIHTLADLFAEVISILAQSRFQPVRKRFTAELKELRAKEPSPQTTQSIISLLMGMKFFRVKMVPIEEFEASFLFMQDCAQYFLEVKDKDIKHALAGLFVEILVPVAASVKNEVNVPCLKNFVESLYSQTLDMCTKSKHRLALFPLVTCLLCVSQKSFFLQNWYYFLAMCLSHLKNRDPKMSRVALESLYRLLWVYMIRIKCESNSATLSRLQSIVNSLFPKGSKGVVPRDTPLNIFVKIIQFIAQERLDFAMREIVFDLLSVGRPIKVILTPERMSIGLRAFLVVADSLQQKEGEPPMPRTSGVLPSGNTLRIKKTFLNKVLTDDTARSIGMSSYFPHVRRVFVDILRALDIHYGRPLMMTSTQNVNKEPDEMLTGERKPRIDLFRTCVAAVPRLIPETMTGSELVDLLSRLTVHMDEELRALAYQSLQTLVIDFPDWRNDVIFGFTQFLAKDLLDTFPQLVDNGMRMLLQLLTSWKNAISPNSKAIKDEHNRTIARKPERAQQSQPEMESAIGVFHQVEGLALVMLCSCRPYPRRLAIHILREIKCLFKLLGKSETTKAVIDVMDKNCPQILEKCVTNLSTTEKTALLVTGNVDLQWIADRASTIWSAGTQEESSTKASTTSLKNPTSLDVWTTCLFNFLKKDILITHCPSAVIQAWPVVYHRLHTLFSVIDPTPVSDNRASLLRSSAPPRKPASERDQYMLLWRSYVIFAMRVVPPAPSPVIRCASPDLSLSIQGTLNLHNFLKHAWEEFESDSYSLNCMAVTEPKIWRFRSSSSPDNMTTGERNDSKLTNASPSGLYKLIVPLLRCEAVDVREAAVFALSSVNPDALKDLMEELAMYIRDAIDKKQENMRRRRRRDALRLQLVKVFELIAAHGTFGVSSCVLDRDTHSLHPTIIEYIDGARICLETEADKESLRDIKLHFCNFIRKMIKSFSLETYPTLLKRDLRSNLFSLFRNWSGPYGSSLKCRPQVILTVTTTAAAVTSEATSVTEEELQFASLQAMSAVLCCGPCFDAQHFLSEDGALYRWLNIMLESKDEKVYQLAYETVILLLECNPDVGALLDWVVDRCYTAEPQVADGCFLALAVIFSAREYPCDHYTAIINVTLMNTGCPRKNVHETALQLLQVLDKRFFGTVGLPPAEGEFGAMNEREKERTETLGLLLSTTYCCSQTHLSQQLSQLHPELTMPMFSEITFRFQTARPEVRQLQLQYILPWLYNMELVDPNIPPPNCHSSFYQAISCFEARPPILLLNSSDSLFQGYYSNDVRKSGSRREGWGSAEATEMVLNNLFYITAKFSNEHSKEIEDVWATLCSCWPNNLKVIMRYLLIICGMASNELLPHAKRVTVYLARARPDRLLDEMLTELQTVETLNCLIERTETPPYYRLTSMRKISGYSDPDPHFDRDGANNELSVEKGTIHTKRHSSEEGIASNASGSCKSESNVRGMAEPKYGTLRSNKSRVLSSHVLDENKASSESEVAVGSSASGDDDYTICRDDPMYQYDVPLPHPLPMPEYGGYFAPLIEYIPEHVQPSSGFHRCNLAVILLTDVVVDSVDLDWSVHIPLMLHILFLGMDQSRTLINHHCKQLLLNLLIVLANHADHLSVAQILLNRKVIHSNLGLPTPTVAIPFHNFTETDATFDSYLQSPIGSSQSTSLAVIPSPTSTCDTLTSPQGISPSLTSTVEESSLTPLKQSKPIQDVVKSLIDFIASKKELLWNYEDITAKVWSIRSVEQLDIFLQHVLRIFQESLPHALINERWAQTALQLGLSCSSRHYAGRSLQVFRFLRVPITSRMLSDILSRLVETIAEQGEDMQGYVTELLLTLESSVDSLDSDFRPLDFMKDIFKSTPNLNKDAGVLNGYGQPGKRVGLGAGMCAFGHLHHGNANAHARSTSYSVSHYYTRRTPGYPATNEVKDIRRESDSRHACSKYAAGNLSRSRSAQSLKLLDSASQDDKMLILAQLFWLAVSVLESDYEYEYLLALRLLNRVLHRLPLDRPDTVDKVEKLFGQLRWTSFQGVQALLLKGCTNPAIYEAVVPLLSQFTLLLDLSVVDPSQNLGFPMNVVALLPYMLLHYEDANELCVTSAENIAQISTEKGKKLENLGTVMTLYSRRTFSKESFQWTKCVVKYLHDTYSHVSMTMLTFMVELLEKGPNIIQLPVLNIIHCMLHYVDLSPSNFNSDLLVAIAKFVEGVHHKEVTKILKLVVTRSSTLVAAPSQYPFLESHYSSTMCPTFADVEVFVKKELPGRTMDFTFEVNQTPLIGRQISTRSEGEKSDDNSNISHYTHDHSGANHSANASGNSPRRSSSLSPADNAAIGWKRPWLSQSRVRECLVNLLTTCGQRVGLPKSPSEDLLYSLNKVIFSQSSDLLERQSSMASSTEEVSGPDLSAESRRNENDHFGVFKDFDFLEYESESVEGESTDNFNWGVRRRPLSGGDFDVDLNLTSQAADSLSEKTPLLTIRTGVVSGMDDSSDEELGSESPLDEMPPLSSHLHDTQSSSSSIRLHDRERRDSATRSDISDSSVGDLGDLTPCNTSPNLPAVMSFRSLHRDDTEEMWRFQLCLLFEQAPNSSLHVFHLMYKLIKDIVSKSISVTHSVCNLLSEFEGSTQLQTHLTTVTCILAARAHPIFIWFNTNAIPLSENLRFGLMQLREHLDTFLDRKDQANECVETLKAILKLQQLRDESVGTELINEESVVDVGKALYKFHIQLLLLLETANKMYNALIAAANQAQLENVSQEVIMIRKALMKAHDEYSDLSEDGTPSPQLLFAEQTDSTIVQFLHENKWFSALKFIRHNRITWLNELISSSPDDEDDVINILTVYCTHLVDKKPDAFVMIDDDDLSSIQSSLMDELMQLLVSLNETESKIKEQKEKNYASH